MNGNPISFLPQDTINPAIQNLGQTLGAINQQKIGRQEDLQKKFQSLLDVSYEGMLANHQNEVMKDWDKFKSNAINVFKSASEAGTPINQNEYSKVLKEHNDVIRKAEYARQLKQDYYKTAAQIADLKSKQELDPETDKAIDDWMNAGKAGKSMYDLAPISSLVKTQLSPTQRDAIEKEALSTMKIARSTSKIMPDGTTEVRNYYDPNVISASLTDKYNMNPEYKRSVDKSGGLATRIETIKNIYNKNDMIEKHEPSYMFGGNTSPVAVSQKIPLEDGTFRIIFPNNERSERPILLNGETVMASSPEANYNPITNTYKTTLRVKREVPKPGRAGKNGEKTVEYEDIVTDDYGVYRNFSTDIKSKNPDPKLVKGNVKKGAVPAIKLTGDEDSSTLELDKVYELNGEKVKWNGKNLVRQK